MDWKYKHFNEEAVFSGLHQSVLEAARLAVADSLGEIQDTADGFVARGHSAWHPAVATIRVSPAPNGTQVAVELLVERAAMRGYMLFDIGGYYNGQIDKWFAGISQRLSGTQEQALVSKTTSGVQLRRGFLTGCLVYLLVGVCLGIFAIPLDRALWPASSGSAPGPFAIVASLLGLLAGVGAFLYVMNPDAPAAKSIRARLHRARKDEI